MNTYKNKKTGATITTASVVSGGDWEPAKGSSKPAKQRKLTKPELLAKLDEAGIEYHAGATNAELLELLATAPAAKGDEDTDDEGE